MPCHALQAAVLHTEHASRSQPFAISPEACADAATCAHSMQAMDGAGLHVVTSGATTDEPLHTDAQSHSATGAHPCSITGQSKRANSFIGQHQQQQQHALSSDSSNTISAGQGAAHKHYKRQFHGPKEAQQISAPQEPTQTQDQKRTRESAAAAAYPKVALLFLVGGAVGGPLVHNEAVWRAWLKDAEALGLGGLPPPPPAGIYICICSQE